jgi:hypothetical protein
MFKDISLPSNKTESPSASNGIWGKSFKSLSISVILLEFGMRKLLEKTT